MRRLRLVVVTFALLASPPAAAPALAEDLAVIVHASRSVRLTRTEVAQIYLKRRRFWEDGQRIVPVNRDSGSAAREAFVRMVLGQEAARLVVYWNQQYFHGVLPPATLASDEAVKRFVASEPRAIGYVDATAVDASVRVALLLEDHRAERQIRLARSFRPGWLGSLVSRLLRRPGPPIAATF